MKLGVLYQWDPELPPHALARLLEARGVESIWFSEHSHIPVGTTLYQDTGEELADVWRRVPDPIACLAAAAAATERLVLGTAVTLVTQRDPILLAKAVATVDQISGGRIELGVGAGWNEQELRNHGTELSQRFGILRERVEAMKAIWTQEEASYHGRHVDFDPIWCAPKPVRQPHPPILVGGDGPRVLDRVIAYGDGWIATPPHDGDHEAMLARVRELQVRARSERGLDALPVTLVGAPLDRDLLHRYAGAGVTRAVIMLRADGDDDPDLSRLDTISDLLEGAPA